MSRFHGWFDTGGSWSLVPRPAGGGSGAIQVFEDRPHGLAVLIAGDPRWTDAEIALWAREGGHAQALFGAYRRHGERLFDHLEGAFSLAVLDSGKRTALLAVDRFGIGRLCYARTGRELVFGSTVDAVTAHERVGFEVDPQGVYDYLYHHAVPAPRTIARGVSKVEAGHYVRCNGSAAPTSARYWQCAFDDDSRAFDERRSARELVGLLEQATAEHSNGSRPAAFLSGGIDSSTVAGMLARVRHGDARTFTIGFEAAGYDEVRYARITAQHFGTRAHEYYVTPADVASAIERIAAGFDEPFGNSSAVPVYYCAQQAKHQGVARLLAGDGGDELFGGNVRYAKQKVFEWYFRLPRPLRAGLIEPLASSRLAARLAPLRKLSSYVTQANVPLPDRLQSYNYLWRESPAAILHPELLAAVDGEAPLREERAIFGEPHTHDLVNRMLYLDWKYTLADNDLRKVTTACALAGVEVRFPWLDDRIVQLSTRVPGPYKVRGRRLRYFVKRALKDFLPRAVIEKPKHGFGLPFGVWMREDRTLQGLVSRAMAGLRERRLVRPDYIEVLQRRHREEHAAYYGEFLWVLMMLELWLQKHTRS